MNPKTKTDWLRACARITAGYTPGGLKANTYLTADLVVRQLLAYQVLHHHMNVLDIGSGNGRLAMGLADAGWKVNYLGLEIIKPCVDFCQETFAGMPSFRFQWLDARNPRYWGKGSTDPCEVVLGVADGWADLVCCMSLFSHLETEAAAAHYMCEIQRVLKPGGHLVATWYSDPPYECSTDPARTVYERKFITGLYEYGWTVQREAIGAEIDHTDQWVIVARKDGGHALALE